MSRIDIENLPAIENLDEAQAKATKGGGPIEPAVTRFDNPESDGVDKGDGGKGGDGSFEELDYGVVARDE